MTMNPYDLSSEVFYLENHIYSIKSNVKKGNVIIHGCGVIEMTIENENQKLMMSSKEAAKSLGVSFPTLKKLIKRENHPIPVLRTGTVRGHILIPYESLQQWVSEEIELQKNRKA